MAMVRLISPDVYKRYDNSISRPDPGKTVETARFPCGRPGKQLIFYTYKPGYRFSSSTVTSGGEVRTCPQILRPVSNHESLITIPALVCGPGCPYPGQESGRVRPLARLF